MLQVKQLTFGYSKTPILKAINFNVDVGEHIAIIGKSGSGKSTLLKLIYGVYDLRKGEIWWKDTQILGPKFNLVIGYDFMKYVAQEFDVMPYTTVEDNIGTFLSRFYPKERQKRVNELIKVVELESFAKVKVKTLSGGQKQRVAIAKALAKTPEILLLDEPFSHIDNFKKQSLRRNVFNYLKSKNITCIVATHNKEDVLGFADTMLVLHDKEIIAKDTPRHLYTNPKRPLIASFFGEFSIINNTIVYAHQIRVVNYKTNYKAMVIKSYFNAKNWLVEASLNDKPVYFEHITNLKKEHPVYLEILK